MSSRLRLAAQVPLPTSVAFDAEGRLWGAGGALHGPGAAALNVAAALPTAVAPDGPQARPALGAARALRRLSAPMTCGKVVRACSEWS